MWGRTRYRDAHIYMATHDLFIFFKNNDSSFQKRSRRKNKTLRPEWEETLWLRVSDPQKDVLQLSVKVTKSNIFFKYRCCKFSFVAQDWHLLSSNVLLGSFSYPISALLVKALHSNSVFLYHTLSVVLSSFPYMSCSMILLMCVCFLWCLSQPSDPENLYSIPAGGYVLRK